MACISFLTIFREALPLFSENLCKEINEKLSNEVHVFVRATRISKDAVKQSLEEFARVAEVCYVAAVHMKTFFFTGITDARVPARVMKTKLEKRLS